MKTFVLTGGIATGKSTVLSVIREFGAEFSFFDADDCVRSFYREKDFHELVAGVTNLPRKEGFVKKTLLREKVFTDPEVKNSLEELIHPLVRKECLAQIDIAKNDGGSKAFFADIPLFFETNFLFDYDQVLLVAISESTQFSRLIERNAYSEEVTRSMIQSQIPISDKIEKSDLVIWNEGKKSVTVRQVERFLNTIN